MDTVVAGRTLVPRREGEAEVDLATFAMLHRAFRSDFARLADLVDRLGSGGEAVPPERARAVAERVRAATRALRVHHREEDEVLWPVIAGSAGAAVDLGPLTEDHHDLDPLLDAVDRHAGRFAADPAAAATGLAAALWQARTHIDEHIRNEEATVFPVMRRYVSVADFAWCEKQFRRFGGRFSDLVFAVGWAAWYADPAVLKPILRAAPPFWLLHVLTRRGYAKRDRFVFGTG